MKISIITAVYNGAHTIADCVQSVRSQTHEVEYIVIDGGSTDATLELVRRRAPSAKILSEPDNGMYDALNKGLRMATGDVIGMLHADDLYDNSGVLAQVSHVLESSGADTCYGDLVYVDRQNTNNVIRYWRSSSFDRKRFLMGWMPPHPAFFVRRAVYEKFGGFNLALGTAADYELMLRFLYKHGVSSCYLPQTVVRMRVGGMSNVSFMNRLRANRMDRLAWELNGLRPRPWTLLLKPARKITQYFLRPKDAP